MESFKLEGIGSDGTDTEDMDVTNHPHCMKVQEVHLPQPIPIKPRGHPTACSGNPMSTQQKAEPLKYLALRIRGSSTRLKSSLVPWELSLPT